MRGEVSLAGYRAVLAFRRLDTASSWVVAVTLPTHLTRGSGAGPRCDTPASLAPESIAEFEELRRALWRSVVALRARASAERRAKAAEKTADELRRAARWRELLVHELNHRVKNMLATIQSLASQMLRGTGSDPDRFLRDFTGRLGALAQAHDLLTARNWEGAELGTLVPAALAPWRQGGQVAACGPEHVHLTSRQAQAFALAL